MADNKNDSAASKAAAPAGAVDAVADAAKAMPQAAAKVSAAATDAVADTVKAAAKASSDIVAKSADAVSPPAPKARTTPARKAPARAAAKRVPATAATKVAAPVAAKRGRKPAAAGAATASKNKSEAPKRVTAPVAAKTQVRDDVRTTLKTVDKGNIIMNNEAKQAADRFQAVFGDVNDRAKGVIERNSRIAEEFTELSKGNVEAVVASSKVAAKGVETLGQELAEFNRKSFEDASAALRSFAEVKSPTDFFRLQSEFARGQFDALIAESSKLSETMLKVAGEVAQPIASRYSAAAERVRTVVAA